MVCQNIHKHKTGTLFQEAESARELQPIQYTRGLSSFTTLQLYFETD